MMDCGSGSADAEPLAEVPAFRQRRCGGVSGARQPDQPGWRARPIYLKKGASGELVTSTWSSSSTVPTTSKNSA